MALKNSVRRFAWHWNERLHAFPPSAISSTSGAAPSNCGPYLRWNSIAVRIWLTCTFNPMSWIFTMTSLRTTTTTDLQSQLLQLGLNATAHNLDDFMARAAKSRWSPQLLLEELARSEIRERSRRS